MRERGSESLTFAAVDQRAEGDLERLLRLVPYFKDLDRVSLARIAGALEPLQVPKGTVQLSRLIQSSTRNAPPSFC